MTSSCFGKIYAQTRPSSLNNQPFTAQPIDSCLGLDCCSRGLRPFSGHLLLLPGPDDNRHLQRRFGNVSRLPQCLSSEEPNSKVLGLSGPRSKIVVNWGSLVKWHILHSEKLWGIIVSGCNQNSGKISGPKSRYLDTFNTKHKKIGGLLWALEPFLN